MCVAMTTQSSSSVMRVKRVSGSKALQLPALPLMGLFASRGCHESHVCHVRTTGVPWAHRSRILRRYTRKRFVVIHRDAWGFEIICVQYIPHIGACTTHPRWLPPRLKKTAFVWIQPLASGGAWRGKAKHEKWFNRATTSHARNPALETEKRISSVGLQLRAADRGEQHNGAPVLCRLVL